MTSIRGRRALVTVSALQLAAGVAGQVIAVRDGRAFDIALIRWRGRADQVARDSWLLGTGLSAPVAMLTAQAVLTTRLALRPSRRATVGLGLLGATMSGGYLVEREVRDALRPRGWNRRTTPVVATGSALAFTMAVMAVSAA